ncbi:MAG: beta-hydroxyacyl-ACP dehydratase [Prevotella sp.]
MTQYDIRQLIPQREPMIMVDSLLAVNEDEGVADFTIGSDNFFLDDTGHLEETGLMEHIAQSALAMASHRAVEKGRKVPLTGYTCEVRNFRCSLRPCVGDTLNTSVSFGIAVEGVRIIHAKTIIGQRTAAMVEMKIYIKPS